MKNAPRKTAIVIGAGAAGIACGSYLRMNGYDATILEAAATPGGVCVAWKRREYLFDGATNWIPGSSPSVNFNAVWKELIDFDEMPLLDFDEFECVELANGATLHVYTDALKLQEEMLRVAPEDRRAVKAFITGIIQASRLRLPISKPPVLFNILDLLKIGATSIPLGLFFLRWKRISIERYAERFSNSDLRELFKLIFMRHEFFSVLGLLMSLGWMHARSAGYPLGGSNRVVGLLQKRCKNLGGVIRCACRVKRIIVENGRAAGVELDNGERLPSDLVVAACDGRAALFGMLGGKYLASRHARAFADAETFPAIIQVSLGVARKFDGITHKIHVPFPIPLAAGADTTMTHFVARFTGFDPCFAPAGKTAVVVHIRTTDWEYWTLLRDRDPERYASEKQRVADAVIDGLDARFGNVRAAIEVVDVATPATWIRYTGNWKASYQGWAPTPKIVGMTLPKTVPGLRSFYLTGQWVEPPGGLPRVLISARQTVQIICHDDRKPFRASRPGTST